ncbi:MAG: hypothetical protein N3D17_07740 [bacterium]|nr:hypothetical protein [bacterium]
MGLVQNKEEVISLYAISIDGIWATIKEVIDIYDISRRTIYNRIKRGEYYTKKIIDPVTNKETTYILVKGKLKEKVLKRRELSKIKLETVVDRYTIYALHTKKIIDKETCERAINSNNSTFRLIVRLPIEKLKTLETDLIEDITLNEDVKHKLVEATS